MTAKWITLRMDGVDSEVVFLRDLISEGGPLPPRWAVDLREGGDEDEVVGWVEGEGLEM